MFADQSNYGFSLSTTLLIRFLITQLAVWSRKRLLLLFFFKAKGDVLKCLVHKLKGTKENRKYSDFRRVRRPRGPVVRMHTI